MKALIYGCGGHGRVILDVLRSQHGERLSAVFVDDDPRLDGSDIDGIPVRSATALPELLCEGFAAVAGIGNNQVRARCYYALKAHGFALLQAIHASAVVSPMARLAEGVVLMPGAIVNTGARIAENACINTGASADHDVVIGAHAHLFPGARLTGNVHVGDYSVISSGAIVAPGIRVGSNSMIGAGAVVLDDVPDNVVAYGVPARVVRARAALTAEAAGLCAS